MDLQNFKASLPTTEGRVPANTSAAVNARIESDTLKRLDAIGTDPEKIEVRLQEIEQEWDIERILEANAAAATLVGVSLGATVSKRWLLLPALVAGFLFQHAVQGWCPPLPILRRLGFRTAREIENERTILKSRRGDLKNLEISFSGASMRAVEV
ncbi:MAG: DUF2892 domain-containing protein [Bacteriovoracia bacterium]